MGLKVLSALDAAKIQYYHFKAIIIAGMGLFTDAYDLFCISPISVLLSRIYYPHRNDLPSAVYSAMVAAALAGTAVGQLLFGRLGDLVGRRKVYGLALALMIAGSLASAFSVCTTRACVLSTLGFFRFVLGVGIGGDYPLSATIMSEFANKATRGAFIAAVFSMQGFGILFSSVVTMAVCAVFDRATDASPEHTPPAADLAWRVILIVGAIPAGITFYWRMKMPETARYTALVERNVTQAAKDMGKVIDEVTATQMMEEDEVVDPTPPPSGGGYPLFSTQFLRRHGRSLFGCAAAWFLVDVVFYSNNLFQSRIYEFALSENKKQSAYKHAINVVKIQAIIAVCSTIPGYFFTVFFIERLGRRRIQMMGFVAMAGALFAIGGPYSFWNRKSKEIGAGFMVLYGLAFFFSNFGPNTTTFIVPAELFPARFRTTCHGIAGAAGKVGAMIGSVGFLWASDHRKKSRNTAMDGGNYEGEMMGSLMALGGVCLVGLLVTYWFVPETKGISLEENEREDFDGNGTVHTSEIQFSA